MVFSFHIASVTLGEHAYRTRTRERAGSTRLQAVKRGVHGGGADPPYLDASSKLSTRSGTSSSSASAVGGFAAPLWYVSASFLRLARLSGPS